MKQIDDIRTVCRSGARVIAHWLNAVSGGKVTPNMITAVGAWMHVPIALFIAHGNLWIAAVLLVVFGLFDVLDGELARLQGSASSSGMLLDATTDRLKEMLLYSGVAYYISVGDHPSWAFVAAIACGASLTVSYAKAKGEVALALKKNLKDHHSLNRHFKQAVVPFEIRMAILIVGLLSGQLIIASVVIAVLALASVEILLQSITKQLKD